MSFSPTIQLYIFDADGTLRRTTVPGQPSPKNPGEWELVPNVKETLSRINWGPLGCALGIASNQDGVGLGDLSREMAQQLLKDMVVEAVGYLPSRVAVEMCTCPVGSDCKRKKPEPGMLLEIIHRFSISPEETLFVGDMEWDQQAAHSAGVHFMWAKEFFGRS